MPKDINLLDPLGIAKAVRGQVNQMAAQAKLPSLPNLPAIKVNVDGIPLVTRFNQVQDRPGMATPDRAG